MSEPSIPVLIPEPQHCAWEPGALRLRALQRLCVGPAADGADWFAAEDLAERLATEHGVRLPIEAASAGAGGPPAGEGAAAAAARPAEPGEAPVLPGAILLARQAGPAPRPEAYRLTVRQDGAVLAGADAAGLFWATRTLLQAVRPGSDGPEIPCVRIEDWPDFTHRAVHYDTKHHQDTFAYVGELIRLLAGYKLNMLVWEWEDKLAYERHPEIGAPGAFRKTQMQELTALAARHHMQLVPLVQGLGHVSYILKHPQHRHLREIPSSAWEFCPLRAGTYQLLFDLWDEAMEATPGVGFLHIGSDETYELGLGEACGCRQRAATAGKDSLMRLFLERAAAHVVSRGRTPLCWAHPPAAAGASPPGMIYADASDVGELEAARQRGHQVFVYAPNPGIEPLFLGYFPWVQASMWRDDVRRVHRGAFADTSTTIAAAARAGLRLGSITTSWDDSGLHILAWIPRFVCAAAYSWNAAAPDPEHWPERFFSHYFGPAATDIRELFGLLQEGALFYYDTFQRRVWHWGDIGKIHLPDLPRADLEYSEFWRRRYAQLLHAAAAARLRSERALRIIDANLARPLRQRYDLEVYRTCAELMRHNADLVGMLGELEAQIEAAHRLHFADRRQALDHLCQGVTLIERHLTDRERVFADLVAVWERTRLPKGIGDQQRPYAFAQDRARHFANRTPDMRYLILDEELLDLEGYLEKLRAYCAEYAAHLEE